MKEILKKKVVRSLFLDELFNVFPKTKLNFNRISNFLNFKISSSRFLLQIIKSKTLRISFNIPKFEFQKKFVG